MSKSANLEAQANLLSAMSNSKRLAVLKILINNEAAVGPLAEQVGLSQSALSQHLAKLRELKLVQTRRDSQTIFYSCQSSSVQNILNALELSFGAALPSSRKIA